MSSKTLHGMLREMSATGSFYRSDSDFRPGIIYVVDQTKLDFCNETLFPTYYLQWDFRTEGSSSNPTHLDIILNGLTLPECPLADLSQVPSRYQHFVQNNKEFLKTHSPDKIRQNRISSVISSILRRSQPKCTDVPYNFSHDVKMGGFP